MLFCSFKKGLPWKRQLTGEKLDVGHLTDLGSADWLSCFGVQCVEVCIIHDSFDMIGDRWGEGKGRI